MQLLTAPLDHSFENLSLYSIWYPVIGEPPSFSGGVHCISTISKSQSVTSRLFGLDGSSVKECHLFIQIEISFIIQS